jgi:hypothetical protein
MLMQMLPLPGNQTPQSGSRLADALPSVTLAILWWILAMAALSIRVASALWTPVVELFWWQALLFEKLLGTGHQLVARLGLLGVYVIGGLAFWRILRRLRSAERHRWPLALAGSAIVQLLLLGLGMWLAPE